MLVERFVKGPRAGLLVLCVLSCTGACERGDADRASTSPHDRAPLASTTKPPAKVETARATSRKPTPRCVVPLPDRPPDEAPRAASCPPDPESAPTLPQGRVRFVDAPESPAVEVEIARTEAHRRRGLMYRTELASNAGMLFSWPRESRRSFWMRNTCIPLDMLFIAKDGTIVGVLEQVPTLSEHSRSIPCPAAYVLEVNAGWVRAHGVEPGQRIEIDS